MPRRKRVQGEEDELTPSKRRTRDTPKLCRSIRKQVPQRTRTTETAATPRPRRRILSVPATQDTNEDLSDSSSLSDPPSEIVPPTPQGSIPSQSADNETKAKHASTKNPAQVKKVSSKEHEDALNRFTRDDSEDESSDSSSEDNQANDPMVPADLSSDEDEDWEDVDLSHKTQVSLDDLSRPSEALDLEVTLDRTQQSMRIK
jgi:hypothetical protein